MKKFKLSAAIVILTIFPFLLNAQYQDSYVKEKSTRWGIFIAPSVSWMNQGKEVSKDGNFSSMNLGSKGGFYYGFTVDYSLTKNVFLVTGLQGNITGGKMFTRRIASDIYAPNIVNTAEFNYKLHYIELPVNLKFRTNDIAGFHFFGQAGLSLAANISKKADYEIDFNDELGNQQIENGQSEKISGYLTIAPFLLQLNTGLGLEYDLGNSNNSIYAGVFYNNSFMPDLTNPEKYEFPYNLKFQDGRIRLNSFSLRIGIMF